MNLRLALALAFALLAASTITAASLASQSTASSCESGSLEPLGSALVEPGEVPIVFVHGMEGKPKIWSEQGLDGSDSIAAQVGALPGASVWTFDYQATSLDWVTNPTIGPALSTAISCLARTSGKLVIVIAHSMGGLATQYAAAQSDGAGGTTGSHIGELITIATPFEGSKALTVAQGVLHGAVYPSGLLGAAVEAILSACAGIGQVSNAADDGCSLAAVPESPVGTALMFDSPQIAALPRWPAGLPVKNIAGDIDVTVGILGLHHTFDLGDIMVSQDSATAHNTDGSPEHVVCSVPVSITQIRQSSCEHGKLPQNSRVVNDVLAVVRRVLAREGATATQTTNSATSGASIPPLGDPVVQRVISGQTPDGYAARATVDVYNVAHATAPPMLPYTKRSTLSICQAGPGDAVVPVAGEITNTTQSVHEVVALAFSVAEGSFSNLIQGDNGNNPRFCGGPKDPYVFGDYKLLAPREAFSYDAFLVVHDYYPTGEPGGNTALLGSMILQPRFCLSPATAVKCFHDIAADSNVPVTEP